MEPLPTGADPSEPLPTVTDRLGDWLSVSEAVIYCTNAGLPRTAKTVCKWARRAFRDQDEPGTAARQVDISNGFRWALERNWLDRKIAEEFEYEARKRPKPVEASSNPSQPVHTDESQELQTEQVGTSHDTSEPVQPEDITETLVEPDANPSEPVQTGKDESARITERSVEIELLREQLAIREEQVTFYQEELRHRRNTDRALNDVIQGFLTQAENNRAQLKLEAKQNGIDVEWSTGDEEPFVKDGV